jgi:hypothetical protein
MAENEDKGGKPDSGDKAKGATPESGGQDDYAELRAAIEKERELRKTAQREALTNADAAKKLQGIEDSNKSETQKLLDRVTAAEAKVVESEHRSLRLEIAVAKGLTPAVAKRLVGTTREELESDADELLATIGGTPVAGEADKGVADTKKATTGGTQARPTEKLTPGAVAGAEAVEMDPAKLAAKIPREY